MLGVTISDCQLPKFTENRHKIAQGATIVCTKCLKIAGVGSAGKGGRREIGEAPWLLEG